MCEMKGKSLRLGLFRDQIWLITLCLMVVSLAVVYSASEMLAYREAGGVTSYYLVSQAKHMFLGLLVMLVVQFIPPRMFYRYSYLFLLCTVVLLLMTIVMGTSVNQARRSLRIFGVSFQMLEFARIPLVVFLAAWFAGHQADLDDFRKGLLPPLLCTGVVCGLILFGGMSLTVLAGVTALSMFLLCNVRWRHIMRVGVLALLSLLLGILLLPYVSDRARNATWASRWESFIGKGDANSTYQAEQAKIAIAGGKLFGKGPGAGTQRFSLPNPQDDFVYASLVEEYGFVLGVGVIVLYLWLLWRVRVLVRRSTTLFHSYVVMGLGVMMVFQAFWHMSISVGLSPTTGITLPLISLGGTSILSTCLGLGILLSVSRYQRRELLGEAHAEAAQDWATEDDVSEGES